MDRGGVESEKIYGLCSCHTVYSILSHDRPYRGEPCIIHGSDMDNVFLDCRIIAP